MTLDRVPVKIKVNAKELEKYFTVGESVRILQGCHAGEPGQILELVAPEKKHAVVLMEYTKAELKVLITNLRRKEEEDPSSRHSLSEFLTQSNPGASHAPAKSIAEQYSPGDLVILEQHNSTGLILQL